MNWFDYESYIEICTPLEFNFRECLKFLGRSDQEVLHQIKGDNLNKLLKVAGELILCKIGCDQTSIQVDFPLGTPTKSIREKIAAYICEWFDLERDLSRFYEMASNDKILQPLTHKYYGLRMICMPDLFEALVWAIMGQQINLTFAYTLKKRFVEHYGECLTFGGETYWLFPSFERIVSVNEDDLRGLQFTGRKTEYIIDIAKSMASGELTKDMLLQKEDTQQVKKFLMGIRGVGAWTADYVMMKCFHDPNAFPVADVGLHNALKSQLGLNRKPTIEELKEIETHWEGWQAYATFYLWRSLYDETV
ncbi:DNA-3-methyladenine glycosylase family protein [Lysinibacillus sp. NPDC097287]|uniref:DNA-3-methyladenine glycosylase family protein n=1 Tax=Lysinibacillus sp. NPDC097287 TaxID=3364144 RepID=UPI0037F375A8